MVRDNPNVGLRYCASCMQNVPRENYSHKKAMCRTCEKNDVDDQQKKLKIREAQEIFEQLTEATDPTSSQGVKLETVLDAIYDKFGGAHAFANKLYAQLNIAMTDNPGKSFVLKAFVDIMRLTNAANKLSHAKDVAEMTDEQLRNEMEVEAFKIVMESRNAKYALALKALDAVGAKPEGAIPAAGAGMSIPEFYQSVNDAVQ